MRYIFSTLIILLLCSGCQKAQIETLELNHYVEEIEVPSAQDSPGPSELPNIGHLGFDPGGIVSPDNIVNTGLAVWEVVERNRAVTRSSSLYANALPSGVFNGTGLENFSPLERRSFRAHGTNGFGNNVYEVQYTVLHRHGGQYQGRGRYLDTVTVVPTHVQALWGYTVEVSASAAPPTNVGTRENPVAALVLEVAIRVSTIIKSVDSRRVYEFRGDSDRAQDATAAPSAVL